MAFTEVASLDADNIVALGKTDKKTGKKYPKQAEGYYLGKRTVANKRGESNIHFLKTGSGNLGLWGTTDLDRKLSQVTAGTMIRVTSTGTKPTPNGDMYTYKVEQDNDNTIDVVVEASQPEYAEESSDEDDGNNETNYLNPHVDSDDEDAAQSAALAAAERKAKVEALLAKGKSKVK